MTKRIFRSICLVAICVMLASVGLFMGVLYNYFSSVQQSQLEIQTSLAAQGVANEGDRYFEGLNTDNYRITWINPDGNVLYDSKYQSATMENHLQREEVKEALNGGIGKSSRYSSTLLERSLYCAQRLPDGTVLRLSVAQNSLITLLFGMMQPLCVIILIALGCSLFLASRLSKKIVSPLNDLNLDDPLSNTGYEELSPLLRRISAQQHQIRQQREALARKQQEFDAVTMGMSEGIVLLNPQQEILSINPAAQNLLEADEGCVGTCILAVNRNPELQDLLATADAGTHAEKLLELQGGTYQVDASPIVSDGTVIGMVLLLLDVTQRQKAEQMRRQFTANVSHELKTPLHTISGCAELLANGVVRQEDVGKFSTQIYTDAQRLIHLVEDIIRLSHLDESNQSMEKEDVDLYALAQQTVSGLLPVAEASQVSLSLKGERAVISGVPQVLQSIILNLCDNAIKYNRKGGTVTVSVKDEPQAVRLSVADTGIGIPAEYQERIFERFYRVDESHFSQISGTGLGLSIVKHAARLHNASISLQSQPDKGSSFTLLFPKKQD